MQAAIYIRTSTLEQHPEKQRTACIELANKKGYEVFGVYEEQISAYKDIERPVYEKIKHMARGGEIKAVIVWALDRWVRNRDYLLEDVTLLRQYGCKLHSVQEDWLEAVNIDGPLGRTLQEFLLGLVGSLGEMESQLKSERVKMAFKKHRGKRWGRPKTHTNKKKVIWEYLDSGLSLRATATKAKVSIGLVHKIKEERDRETPPTK